MMNSGKGLLLCTCGLCLHRHGPRAAMGTMAHPHHGQARHHGPGFEPQRGNLFAAVLSVRVAQVACLIFLLKEKQCSGGGANMSIGEGDVLVLVWNDAMLCEKCRWLSTSARARTHSDLQHVVARTLDVLAPAPQSLREPGRRRRCYRLRVRSVFPSRSAGVSREIALTFEHSFFGGVSLSPICPPIFDAFTRTDAQLRCTGKEC
jgi:hypothetical protein